MPQLAYEGIDLANGIANEGRCYLLEDDNTLTVSIGPPLATVITTAIDCPFGTSEGFQSLLNGSWPMNEPIDGFKSRKTELWLSDHVEDYETVHRWRTRTRQERMKHPSVAYYNAGGHIQPTLRMSIVPECLWYIAKQFGKDLSTVQRLQCLVQARRSEGRYIEAHPRMFLYSLMEKLYCSDPSEIGLDKIYLAAKYKETPDNRRALYRLIREQRSWMNGHVRDLQPAEIPAELALNHHSFDAFLCALTAWSHHYGECITWNEAGIDADVVDIEGHILVLRLNIKGV